MGDSGLLIPFPVFLLLNHHGYLFLRETDTYHNKAFP